ncbi:MAG TPA: DivIVA domain-containing protein [Conexibacter sp.]|nr:DivIVA domain-containing protein [Conexibacter sp.]
MSLDRRSIEKRDFPARLRGYDRAAVDTHLRRVADELEARLATTADAAAEQVRAVLAAAEQRASVIVADAEDEARRIGSAAVRAHDESTARVTAAASGALERIEVLRDELTTLTTTLGASVGAVEPAAVAESQRAPVESAHADAAHSAAAPAGDAGARLVALDLALSGMPREQAERVLAEQFALGDERASLLDDVYAAAGRA